MPGFKGRGNTGGWGQCWKTVSHAMFAKRLGWVGEGVRTSSRERREAPGVESCASHVAATTAPTPPATERNPRQGPSRQPCPWLCSLRPCRASADPPELGRAGIGIRVSIFCGISAGRDAESDCPGAPSLSGRAQSRHVSRLLVQHSNQSDVIQADACRCRAHTGPQKAACPGERLCSEAGSHLSTFRIPGEFRWSPSHREGFPTWRSSGLASRELAAQAVTAGRTVEGPRRLQALF